LLVIVVLLMATRCDLFFVLMFISC